MSEKDGKMFCEENSELWNSVQEFNMEQIFFFFLNPEQWAGYGGARYLTVTELCYFASFRKLARYIQDAVEQILLKLQFGSKKKFVYSLMIKGLQ